MQKAKTASDSILENLSVKPIEALPQAILHEAFAGEF